MPVGKNLVYLSSYRGKKRGEQIPSEAFPKMSPVTLLHLAVPRIHNSTYGNKHIYLKNSQPGLNTKLGLRSCKSCKQRTRLRFLYSATSRFNLKSVF